MKHIKRISITTLVLVMVLVALLAIPASASVSGDRDSRTYSCSCSSHSILCTSEVVVYGRSGNSSTQFNPDSSGHNISKSVSVSSTYWHYPSGASQANYRTTTRSATGNSVASTSLDGTTNAIVIFSVESTHSVSLTCNGVQYPTQYKWTCAGEPAMK